MMKTLNTPKTTALQQPRKAARPSAQTHHLVTRCQVSDEKHQRILQKASGLITAAAAAAVLLTGAPADAREPFLSSTGGKGVLADEEASLLRLREEKETQVRQELARARAELEAMGVATSEGKLCATPFGIDVVGITEAVALTGALVGGYAARQRKQELERLNEQLRKINLQLRQQARAGTLYAPGLTYVPPGGPGGASEAAVDTMAAASAVAMAPAATAVVVKEPEAAAMAPPATTPSMFSMDEEFESEEARQCLQALKEGKRFLKAENGSSAMIRFEKALMLAKSLGNKVQERRAMRGLAAASRLAKQHRSAIRHLERVLELSTEIGDTVGDADAYGTIADIYTEIGEFEKAAFYYDRYISKMTSDGSPV